MLTVRDADDGSWLAIAGAMLPITALNGPADWIFGPSCLFGAASPLRSAVFVTAVGIAAFAVAGFFIGRTSRRLRDQIRENERLGASEEKFRGLFETSGDAIALFDRQGIIECNDATLWIFGCEKKEQLLGKHPAALSPPTQPCGTNSMVLAEERILVALERGSNRFEWIHLRKDGSEFPAEVMLNAFDLNGERVFQAVVRDISDRKKIEERYRLLAERANDVIWTSDIYFNWDYISPAIERLCGYTVEESALRTLDQILTQESARLAEKTLASAVATALQNPDTSPKPVVLELEFNCKDGSTVWVEVNATLVLDKEGRPARWVGISRDITARREIESQLANAKEVAEAADRSKSEFLANMSHEIRTPLTAILGFADLLREECASNHVSPAAADAVATIASNGKHLLTLINDILDLSKIEAGKVSVERNVCRPDKIIGEVVSLMKMRAQGKGLNLVVDYEGAIPESIRTDAVRLRQILVNLVGNAIKFTEQGTVRISARLAKSQGETRRLQIDVSDTGCGMADDDLQRVFLPFTQADSSTSRRFGGTGLGLTISRKLAQLLGGDIAISSRLGQGSTFHCSIDTGPLDDVHLRNDLTAPSTSEHPETGSGTPGKIRLEGRVLLVEDGPDNQRLISRIIERAGAEVAIADNGLNGCKAALGAYADGDPYHVVLMDMQMPVMDGYQATRVLREAGYRGPIIALTANAMVGDEQKCLDAGCDAYLTKPINRDMFLPCVASFLPVSDATAG